MKIPLWTSARFNVGVLTLLPFLLHLPFLLGMLSVDPLAYFGRAGSMASPLVAGVPWLDPNIGFQAQALGKLAADQWLSGHIPWWNSYNGVGLPLAAEAQPGVFFLPFVLLYHFRLGGLWATTLLQIAAGLGTYGFLRKQKLGAFAACVGGVLFELNGTFAYHGAPINAPTAFLPLLLLAIEHLHSRIQENRRGGWLWIPPVIALSLYSGFPETAYINGLLAIVWVLSQLPALEARQRRIYVGRLTFGVLLGLACSLPLVVPFGEMLGLSYIGKHVAVFAHGSVPVASVAQSLMPWVYGPYYSYPDPNKVIDYGSAGGYMTAVQVFFALLGLRFAPRRVAVVLAGWLLLCLAKTFDIRPISDLANLIPLVGLSDFFRYSCPSWEFVGAVLCAYTLDTRCSHKSLSRTSIALALVVVLTAALVGLYWVRNVLGDIFEHGVAPWTTKWALAWLAMSLAATLAMLCLRKYPVASAKWAGGILVVDAVLAFSMPLALSSSYPSKPDMSGIAYLQAHIALQRVYGLGPLAPNYGAYFGIAQINHNYLPVPHAWVSFVRDHLDPYGDAENFIGIDYPQNRPVSIAGVLRENITEYEKIGVRYVLAEPGNSPFVDSVSTPVVQGKRHTALPLGDGSGIFVHMEFPNRMRGHAIFQIAVEIGNYRNTADGSLAVQVCSSNHTCAEGKRTLTQSVDNNRLVIPLDRQLHIDSLSSDAFVMIRISQVGATHPVALWMSDVSPKDGVSVSTNGIPNELAGMSPDLAVDFAPAENSAPRLVYQGSGMDIYELPSPAKYFEVTQGDCRLNPESREIVDVDCSSPATLLRREAYYPGWHAKIDGKSTSVYLSGELFQGVSIPSGVHRIRFGYRPSHYGLIVMGFALGMLTWLGGAWGECTLACTSRRSRRSRERRIEEGI